MPSLYEPLTKLKKLSDRPYVSYGFQEHRSRDVKFFLPTVLPRTADEFITRCWAHLFVSFPVCMPTPDFSSMQFAPSKQQCD
jgi:hypothetical protein